MKNDDEDRLDQGAQLREIIAASSEQLRLFEIRLVKINNLIRQMELERIRIRGVIAALQGHTPFAGKKSYPIESTAETPGKRLGRREAALLREEAGQAVFAYMASSPKGALFSFNQLRSRFDESIGFMFPRVIAEWNESHPEKKIENNGKPRGERRYFLK